ncbi:MAG TPA: RNA polymerase sigma factor [Solirubrobacteraceae bacterium]|nr:RNA polymerase sigma factor [Solirubrobacteraceae bacterium]
MTGIAPSISIGRRPGRETPDEVLLAALRRGDEAAFVALVERYSPLMLRVALTHVRSRAVAEEVVQESWMGVLSGLGRFEGRSSLKTWIFRILTNRAKTRGERESRCTPFSALGGDDGDDGPAVDPDRFLPASHPQWPGHWASPPADWRTVPDERLLAGETLEHLARAIDDLPARQQQVLVLRDVEGWDSDEVCAALGLTEGNQRVLLHRARARVRRSLAPYLDGLAEEAAWAS